MKTPKKGAFIAYMSKMDPAPRQALFLDNRVQIGATGRNEWPKAGPKGERTLGVVLLLCLDRRGVDILKNSNRQPHTEWKFDVDQRMINASYL